MVIKYILLIVIRYDEKYLDVHISRGVVALDRNKQKHFCFTCC